MSMMKKTEEASYILSDNLSRKEGGEDVSQIETVPLASMTKILSESNKKGHRTAKVFMQK